MTKQEKLIALAKKIGLSNVKIWRHLATYIECDHNGTTEYIFEPENNLQQRDEIQEHFEIELRKTNDGWNGSVCIKNAVISGWGKTITEAIMNCAYEVIEND